MFSFWICDFNCRDFCACVTWTILLCLLICSSLMKYNQILVLLCHSSLAHVKCSWKKLANFLLELLIFWWMASYTKYFFIPTLFWRLKLQQRHWFKPRCKQLNEHLCYIEELVEFQFETKKEVLVRFSVLS